MTTNTSTGGQQPKTTEEDIPKTCSGCHTTEGDYDNPSKFDQCPDCGYVTCDFCGCHHSRGTCSCPTSNMGHPYCRMEPAWYHCGGPMNACYTGDRHPDPDTTYDLPRDAFEAKARKCKNCGEVALCLKKKYRT